MDLDAVDPVARQMIACIDLDCPLLRMKKPSVTVEEDKPAIQTQDTTRTVYPQTSSGMKTVQSIMFGDNGAMTKIYTDGTTSG